MRKKDENKGQKEVGHFLATSYEFKKMKEIATANPSNKRYADWVVCIEKCHAFSDILYRTADLDPETTDNIIAYNLGRNKVNAALYVVGFFSNDANFTYYMLHLRENIQAYLNKQEEYTSSPN